MSSDEESGMWEGEKERRGEERRGGGEEKERGYGTLIHTALITSLQRPLRPKLRRK